MLTDRGGFFNIKAWFSYVGKIPDDRGFYFVPTIPDFADISDIRQRSVPDFSDNEFGGKSLVERDAIFICDRGTGAQQFRGLVMSDGRRRYKFEFSFVGNVRRISQKFGTCREKKKRSRLSRLSPFLSTGISKISSFH